jgi:cytochrome bd-type quinol oxidase subunit 2
MQRRAFPRTLAYVVLGVLSLSGIVWMIVQTTTDNAGDFPALLSKIHGAAAMMALALLGYLVTHIRKGWKAKKNRLSGATLLSVYLLLILSGYGLYYAGDENFRRFISHWHAWIGVAMVALLPIHIAVGRIVMRKRVFRRPSSVDRPPFPISPEKSARP